MKEARCGPIVFLEKSRRFQSPIELRIRNILRLWLSQPCSSMISLCSINSKKILMMSMKMKTFVLQINSLVFSARISK